MYTILNVSTLRATDLSLKEYLVQHEDDIGKVEQPDDIPIDLLLTENNSLMKDVLQSVSLKPKFDLMKYESILNKVKNDLEFENLEDLFNAVLFKDVFTMVDLNNRYSKKELSQLLCAITLYYNFDGKERDEMVICIDDNFIDDLGIVSVDYLISIFNERKSDNHILFLPQWSGFAKYIRSL